MVKPRTFITDEQWQRKQRRQLMDMAEKTETARTLIEKLDANPELRQGLWDVYCRAMRTLGLMDHQD